MTERIIITFNEDGSWRGASSTDFKGQPVPLDSTLLSVVAADINTSLLATVDDLTKQIEVLKAGGATPAVAAPTGISKLKLRRALRDAGVEGLLDAFLAGDPIRANDWADAQYLMLDDPFLVAAVPAFVEASGMTTEQVNQLLISCS